MCIQFWGQRFGKLLAFKAVLIVAVATICLFAAGANTAAFSEVNGKAPMASDKPKPDIEHPFKNPKMYSEKMRCPNCGMMINMWARTRHSFQHEGHDVTTCSLRCMADMANSSEIEPTNGSVALYLDPDKMIPVDSASYVIGSTALGTMTMKSKIAFEDIGAAKEFSSKYGGEVTDFQGAYAAAKIELPKSRMLIDKKRKKTGKIKEPTEQNSCTVCGMHPAKFPKHNSQILTMTGDTLQFCSTQCMVEFNANQGEYTKEPVKTNMAWVTLFSDGMYESAFGSYYVVGSKVDGPMGKEAIPFKFKKNAEEFVVMNGGRIVKFSQLTPELIKNGQ